MSQSPSSKLFSELFRAPWTQASIARGLGCSRQLVTTWANGAAPDPAAAAALWALILPTATFPEALAVDATGNTWWQAERAALAAACSPKWTQTQMAKELRRSRQAVCAYATGRWLPKPQTAVRIQRIEPHISVAGWYD